jgi:hypothetical protein
MPRVVYASNCGFDIAASVASDHRCCAERNLLETWKISAQKHGVPGHRVTQWVKRKVKKIHVFRFDSCGNFKCSFPCRLCLNELKKYGFARIECVDRDGCVVKMQIDELPDDVFTTSQKRLFNMF